MGDKMVIPGPGDDAGDGSGAGESGADDGEQRELLNWDLLFDFHAMIGELEQTDGIVEVHAVMHDPVPNFTIETIEHGLGIRVPNHIRSFYQVTDGLEFSWSYEQDGEVVPGGGAHLFDFATVFDTWLDTLWGVEGERSEEEQDFLWSLRGFDDGAHPQLAEMVVMCVEEEYPTYDLFVHDLSSRRSRLLDVSFREYFDCLLASRGTYGWRVLLAEEGDPHDERAARFYEVAERFFPAKDLERWRS